MKGAINKMKIDAEQFKKAYEAVKHATDDVFTTGLKFADAKDQLEQSVLMATFEGKIEGKNEAERKAAALNMFKTDYRVLDSLEKAYKHEVNNLALARIDLDCLRDILRIDELAVAERLAFPMQTIISGATKEKIKVIPPK
jgi:hypothetical protein